MKRSDSRHSVAPPKTDATRTIRVLEAISIRRKRSKQPHDRYLLKLNGQPIGTYTDAWLDDSTMCVSLLQRTRLTLQQSGSLDSDWELIDDCSGNELCHASKAVMSSKAIQLKLATCTAQLRSAGFCGTAAVLELGEWEKMAKINRVVRCCQSGWRVSGVADGLRTTDLLFAGLLFHALSNEVNNSGPWG